MAFRLGRPTGNSVLQPTNKALRKIAQARIESTVARAVARHENALSVDGSDIYLWVRNNGGLICTCRQPAKTLNATNPIDDSLEGLRAPIIDDGSLPAASSNPGDSAFKIVHHRHSYNYSDPEPPIPTAFNGINLDPYYGLDSKEKDDFDSLAPLETAFDDNQLATLLSEGAALHGGDKTPCGICFSTGRTHGYDLATGKRLVLDASNEFPFILNGATLKPASYPCKFIVNSNASVQWNVDLPAYTNGWLNFTIRNNLVAAQNLQLEWYYQNSWQQLTLLQLMATEGSDRSNTQIRVRQIDTSQFVPTEFTHVELIYSTTKPLLGQMPPLSFAQNFEVLEPLITTEFEILASVNDIPRESVFQDSKFKYLWKVLDVTPKMTANGQVFSFNLNARMVHRSESLYALRVLFDPQVNVHYRGLEIEEGGLEAEETPSSDDDVLRFTLRAGQ